MCIVADMQAECLGHRWWMQLHTSVFDIPEKKKKQGILHDFLKLVMPKILTRLL
jgi:hypothetical protein